MPDPEPTTVGGIVINAQIVHFPFGAGTSTGGGGPPLGDSDELPGDEGGVDDDCTNISGLSDAQKTKYLIQYLTQRIAAMILNQPVQNREWGSALFQRTDGSYGFTPLIPTDSPNAEIDWGSLPTLPNGNPDYGSIVAFIHSHPQLNLYEESPGVWINNYSYYNSADPTQLLRPHSGDWDTYEVISSNAGTTPSTSNVLLFLLGYTETNGVGRMALTEYSKAHYNGGVDTPASAATPELAQMDPPCNETL